LVNLSTDLPAKITHVAPASTSSIVLAFVSRDKMDKYIRVAKIITAIRAQVEEMRTQIITGKRSRRAIRDSINASVILLIKDPEYR
jgi:hypothetical protein